MNKTTTTTTLFMGILLTPDLQYLLEKNTEWKKYCIVEGGNDQRIRRIPFEKKEYLGCYFEGDRILWPELALINTTIREHLEQFFPDVRIEKFNIVIFNQLMLAQ